ncbi:transcriptional regulator AsnC family [Clostridium aceticum]|uniref:siroheme decarboxylase n=1 Tax=Clostridium aceticum TaxID=84022 RepID=A0A0D8IB93_9CLOT|nr:AsnC family transcriptional regulator [Clostridium aceticum]AKL96805.1 transcriptional regulator AsnC family [Clostridium aceticum]KJF27560.1 transcriptional regulator [Clostridium aceticum]
MDMLDKKLLTLLQSDFPISHRPYADLGEQLGITEEEVIKRISELKEEGIIRRVGGVFDSRKLGYYSTLCALQVPEEQVPQVADVINTFPEVTHNYIRNHDYNMWFTLIGPSKEYVEKRIEEIQQKTRAEEIMNLPAVNFFKVNVKFNL